MTMSGGARGGAEPAVEDVSGMDISEDVWDDANGDDTGGEAPEPASRPAAPAKPAARQAAQPEPEADPEADPEDAEEPAEDEAPLDEGEEPTDEEIEAQAAEQLEALPAPQNWPAEEKKFFNALPPTLQHAYMNRARSLMADYTKKTQEVARVRQNYAELDRVISPRVQAWAVGGMSPSMAVTQLLALSDFAAKSPVEFIQYFAQERGIDLTKALPGQAQQGEQGYVDPQIRELRTQIDTLKRQNEQASAAQQQRLEAARKQQYDNAVSQMASQIEQFATQTDNKGRLVNPYFNEVEEDVTKLLAAGAAANLPDAYKMAIWANPAVRAKMLVRSRASENAKARARAEAAKRASSSVTSANGSGARSTAKAPGEMSVGELLRAAARGDIS